MDALEKYLTERDKKEEEMWDKAFKDWTKEDAELWVEVLGEDIDALDEKELIEDNIHNYDDKGWENSIYRLYDCLKRAMMIEYVANNGRPPEADSDEQKEYERMCEEEMMNLLRPIIKSITQTYNRNSEYFWAMQEKQDK